MRRSMCDAVVAQVQQQQQDPADIALANPPASHSKNMALQRSTGLQFFAALLFCILAIAIVAVVALEADQQASEEDEAAFFSEELPGLGLERDSVLLQGAEGATDADYAGWTDLPPFVNPVSLITVPANSNFTILRNHSVAGGGTTGFWGFVTQVGNIACTNMRGELSIGANSCSDGLIDFWGLSNVNLDPNWMTAQFLYLFSTGNATGETSLSFCYFRPWEGCQPTGNLTTLKVQIVDSAAAAATTDLATSIFAEGELA